MVLGSNASQQKIIPPTTFTNRTTSPAVAQGTNTAQQSSFIPPDTNTFPRGIQDVFEAQVALDRLGISSGAIDGLMGSQTRSALRAFQREWGLPETGEIDSKTRSELILERSPCTEFMISSNDLKRLQPVSPTWLGKSRQTSMEFETILEMAAERGHAHPNLIKRLNPAVNWTNVTPGVILLIPDIRLISDRIRASWITIKLGEKVLQAFDAEENLVAHFPCSIARRVEKRPVGDLHVVVAAENPDYTFDPAVFPESAEARRLRTKLLIPPGPNNPVGTAWVGLDKPGYGIHGTPTPEQVGRTESHGCFRLANWNAERLIKMVGPGTPVYVKP